MHRSAFCRLALLFCVLVVVCASPALARTWTSKNGQTTTGKFIRLRNGTVVLQRGGRVVQIPLANFCDADQEYIREKAGLPAGIGAGSGLGAHGGSDRDSEEEDSGTPAFEEGAADDPTKEDSPPGGGSAGASGEPSLDDLDLSFIEERTWTDVQGRQIRAKLVPQKEASDEITLLKDGQTVKVPRNRLSPVDLAYVDQMQQRVKQALSEASARAKESQPGGSSTGTNPPPAKKSPFPTWQPPGQGSSPPMGGHTPPTPPIPSTPTPPPIPPSPTPGMPGAPTTAQPNPAASSPWPSGRPGPSPIGTPPSSRGSFPHHGSPSRPTPGMPSHPTPGMHGGSPINSMPTPTFPTAAPQMEDVYEATCSKCGKVVPASIGAGDHCPHCGVYFEYEEGPDGKRTYSARYWVGSAVGILFVIGGIVIRIMRNVS